MDRESSSDRSLGGGYEPWLLLATPAAFAGVYPEIGMRKLVYHIATTADGFVARKDHSFDCFPMEGEHVNDYLASLAGYGTALMGRRTYELGLKFGVTTSVTS